MEVLSGEDGDVTLNFALSDGTVVRSILRQWIGDRLSEDPEYDEDVEWAAHAAGHCVYREFSIRGITVHEVEFLRDIIAEYAERMELATGAMEDALRPEHNSVYRNNIYLVTEQAQTRWARRLTTQLTVGLEELGQVTPDYIPDDFPDA